MCPAVVTGVTKAAVHGRGIWLSDSEADRDEAIHRHLEVWLLPTPLLHVFIPSHPCAHSHTSCHTPAISRLIWALCIFEHKVWGFASDHTYGLTTKTWCWRWSLADSRWLVPKGKGGEVSPVPKTAPQLPWMLSNTPHWLLCSAGHP